MTKDKKNSEHYFLGDNFQSWRLLDKRELSVIDEEMATYTKEKYHFHKQARQLFYIISGTAEFELEDKKYKVAKEQSFIIEPELKHKIINYIDKFLKFIVISQPSNKNDRFEINNYKL